MCGIVRLYDEWDATWKSLAHNVATQRGKSLAILYLND